MLEKKKKKTDAVPTLKFQRACRHKIVYQFAPTSLGMRPPQGKQVFLEHIYGLREIRRKCPFLCAGIGDSSLLSWSLVGRFEVNA